MKHTTLKGNETTGRNAEEEFLSRFPFDRNVFVMMRYRESKNFVQIEKAIRVSLEENGLKAHFAKDKAYVESLWDNIKTYMNCCKYGIAVFEQIDEDDFNPNISIEVGYMLAQEKRCLILKEKRVPLLATNILGHIYRDFDMFRATASISRQTREWVKRDLGIVASSEILRQKIEAILDDRSPAAHELRKILWLLHARRDGIRYPEIRRALGRSSGDAGVGFLTELQSLIDQGLVRYVKQKESGFYTLADEVRTNLPDWLKKKSNQPNLGDR